MNFDINETLADMLGAIKNSVKEDWPLIKTNAASFLQDKKDRLELLADLRISQQIDDDIFFARLADEKKILESELHAIAILTRVAAQNAANAAIETLTAAVSTALGIVL